MATPGLHAALDSNLAMPISPERPRAALRRLIESAPSVFAQGRSLAIFPQGTLIGIQAAFASGASRIAQQFGRPVLPVVIAGTHNVYDYPFSPFVHSVNGFGLQYWSRCLHRRSGADAAALENRLRVNAMSNDPKPRTYVPERDGFWVHYAFETAEEFPLLREQMAAIGLQE